MTGVPLLVFANKQVCVGGAGAGWRGDTGDGLEGGQVRWDGGGYLPEPNRQIPSSSGIWEGGGN